VKASNFGPHVNVGLIIAVGLAIIQTRSTEKMKKMKIVEIV
jgi:hypothetical protein